jgi:arsenite methyltransferase
MSDNNDERIKQAVRQAYGAAACCSPERPVQVSCGCRSCCSPEAVVETGEALASSFLAEEDLADLSTTVPAIADLQPGEVVLDLGSGGGLDCIRAARKVGPEGRVIGLDMTPEMVKLARHNARQAGATNVEFRYGEIEDIPLPDESVDVIISNCVINLSPDKDAVFSEAYRVLRPGGRMIVSDIVIDGQLPQPIRDSLVAWAGCVAGALEEPDYLGKIRAAGFAEVEVLSRDYVKISQVPDWVLARTALAQANLSPDALDHVVVSASVKARKPT